MCRNTKKKQKKKKKLEIKKKNAKKNPKFKCYFNPEILHDV